MKRLLLAALLLPALATATISLRVAVNTDGTVDTEYPDGSKPISPPATCPTGWTCATKGDATEDIDEVSASAFTIVASGTDDEGNIAYVYKSEGTDTDLQLEARIPSSWIGHLESFTFFGVGITEGTGDADYAAQTAWPYIGTARFKTDAGGAGEQSQLGAAGQFLPRYLAITYDDSETSICGYESDDATDWFLIGTCVTKSITFPALTYVFGTSHDSGATTTADITNIAYATTIDISDAGDPDPPTGNDFPVATGTTNFNCNTQGVEPGDTVTMAAGNRNSMTFENCFGVSGNHITFRNDTTDTGPAVIRSTSTWGLFCDDCEFVTFDGTGKWSGAPAGSCGISLSDGQTEGRTQCGIQVEYLSGSTTAFFKFRGSSSDLIVKGFEIDGTGSSKGIGFDINDHSYSQAAHPGEVRENIFISQGYIHDTWTEGMYVGHNGDQGGQGDDLDFENVNIDYMLVEDTGREGINTKSVVAGTNSMSYNHVRNCGSEKVSACVSVRDGGVNFHHNYIQNAIGNLVRVLSPNDISVFDPIVYNFYNNILVDATDRGVNVIGDSANNVTMNFYNNTVVDTSNECIEALSVLDAGLVRDNICAGTGGINFKAGLINANNQETNVATQQFEDAVGNDFHLTASSPAKNNGTSNAPANDHFNTARPQEGTDDQGAAEYVP